MAQRFHKHNDPDHFFQTEHLQKNLKGRSVRGGAVTLISQVFKFVLQTGGTLLLARLLLPVDFGLIGMVTILLDFIDLFKDLGLSTATIQKKEINHAQVSTLFWINVAISVVITLIVILLTPAIVWFYNEPRLAWVVLGLSANFILGGITIQHLALLKRQMRFGTIAKIEVFSMVFGILSGTTLAFLGAGYWSLVVWRLGQSIAAAIAVWLLSAWRPGKPEWNDQIRSILGFGGNVVGFSMVNYLSRNLDNLLIGRYWGPQQLGLYAMAYKLLLLPIQQINPPLTSVALPVLSRLQEDPVTYCKYYYKATLLLSSIGMPIVGLMFASTDKLVLLFLGPQWSDAVILFKFLAPAALIGTFAPATGWAFTSLGHVKRQFHWGIVAASINVVLFTVGVRWGALGVAAAYGLSRPFFLAVLCFYCFHKTPLSTAEFLKVVSRPFGAASIAIAAVLFLNQIVDAQIPLLLSLVVDCVIYVAVYCTFWILIPGGRKLSSEMIEIVKQARK